MKDRGRAGRILPAALRSVAALCTGWLLASAYEPFGYAESAWVALVPLFLVARYSSPRASFRWGFLAGAVFWLISISWLLALCRTGGAPPLVVLGWILLSCYCAVYMGAFAMTLCWSWRRVADRRPAFQGVAVVLVAPLLWAGFEYLRCTLFTGFAWNQLGVSQYRNIAVIQLAELGGVYAVSAVLVVVNTAVAFVLLRFADVYLRHKRARINVELMIGLVLWVFCIAYGIRAVNRVDGRDGGCATMTVTAIQPNIPQLRKWPEDFAEEICSRLEKQTRLAAMQKPDLIVWPETAVPGAIGIDPYWKEFVADLARLGVPLLAGAMEEMVMNYETVLWNSSFLFGPDGTVVDLYRKCHLVPFGEYLPFDSICPVIKRMAPLGYSCREGERMTVFHVGSAALEDSSSTVAFSSLICFEDTVAPLARKAVLEGARLLINQTNDAWFEGTAGAMQHMSHCVFRCVENRVAAVRCTNSGITCSIDRSGRISLLENEEGAVYAHKTDRVVVAPKEMRLTPYTRFGDLLWGLPCGLAAGLLFVLVVRQEKKESGRT